MYKAALLVAEGVQDHEFFYPYYRLIEYGCELDVILSPYKGKIENIKSKYGVPIYFDKISSDIGIISKNYDLIVIPGGWQAPEIMRMDERILALIQKHFDEHKIIAAICHGPQVLISALFDQDVHLMMTGYKGIMHDIINAGHSYVDKPVVNCENIITAQHYKDNPEFMREILKECQKKLN